MSPTSQLMSAISSNDNETVSKLLEKMDIEVINMKENFGTALHVACNKKNHEALDSLLAKTGIDVNVTDKTGWTPLHTACNGNKLEAVAKLLDRPEIDMNAKSSTSGWTPLHIACIRNNLEAVAKLLDRLETNVNAKSSRCGWTPLHIACNNLQVAAKLLDSPGIDVNIKSFVGCTPLHLACRRNLHTCVKKLLASPGVNARDVQGDTPAMNSAEYCSKDALMLMLDDPRVNLDIKDVKGRRLEEKIRSSSYYSKEGRVTCLEMIKNERTKRENGDVGLEQTSQAQSIERHLVKIEKINKEIGMEEGEGDRKKNLHIRKRKMEDLDGKQTLDKKILAKKHKEEASLLEKNQRHAITVLQETSAREDRDEQRYIASLKEHRDELAQELEKLTNDAGNEACKPEESSKLEPIQRSLECPVCMELIQPPAKIWMCRFTHVICEVCKDRLKAEGGKCPTCTTEPFTGRNYMAENLARTVFNV